MKYIQTLIAMAVGGAVLALGVSVVAQTVKPCMVTIVRIQGEARYSLGDNAWHPLVVGKILGSGAIIQSAADSSVDIVLSGNPVAMPQAAISPNTISFAPDPYIRGLVSYKPKVEQNVVRMWGNTVLAVDKLTQFDTGLDTVSDTELDLRAGRIFLNIKKMSASSQFIIKIPSGVAGIRGFWGYIDFKADCALGEGNGVISQVNSAGTLVTQSFSGGNFYDSSDGLVKPLLKDVLDDLERTLTSVMSSFQDPGAPSPFLVQDCSIILGSKWFSIEF